MEGTHALGRVARIKKGDRVISVAFPIITGGETDSNPRWRFPPDGPGPAPDHRGAGKPRDDIGEQASVGVDDLPGGNGRYPPAQTVGSSQPPGENFIEHLGGAIAGVDVAFGGVRGEL